MENERCDHCGLDFPAARMIPIALKGAASIQGHLVTRRGPDSQIMRVDDECFGLLSAAPIGEVVDLREPPPFPKVVKL